MGIWRFGAALAFSAALWGCDDAPSVARTAEVVAPVSAPDAVDPIWPHQASDLPPDPGVVWGVLDNGMRYAVMANATPPRAASVRLRIDMGSLEEDEDQRGLAHFLEHMAFNGSRNVPEGEMVKILERHGLAFGPDTNAYTSYDETVYQLDVPTGDVDDDLDTALFLMRETAGNLTLDPGAIDRERGVVLSEMRVRNTWGFRYTVARSKFLYPDARISERTPIGVREVLEEAPETRFADLYGGYYTPERALLVVTGDIDPAEVETKIETLFADWAPAAEPGGDPDLGAVANEGADAGYLHEPTAPTVATIDVVAPAVVTVDSLESRKQSLLRDLGAQILSRRFQRLSRAPDAAFLQASASFGQAFETVDSATVQIISEPGRWADALGVAEQELRRAIEYGFTEAELAEQLANLSTGLTNAADQADTRDTANLADGIAGTFGADQVFTHPRSNLARFESYADEITPEAVHAAFKEWWERGEERVFLVTPLEIDNAEAAIDAVFDASKTVPVAPPEDAGALDFAYEDFGPPGEVVARDEIEDLAITEVRFANNVRLNVKSTDFEDDVIRISVRIGAGALELPADAPELAFLASNGFAPGGLEAHSYDDLQSLLAGRNVAMGFNAGSDAYGFSAATTPADFDLQLKVWAAYLTAPGYREEGLAQYRQLISIWYETLDGTPQGVSARDVPRLLRSGDGRWGVPARDALLAADYETLARELAPALGAGAIEIGVVGDVTVDEAIAAVAATFGALPMREPAPAPHDDARLIAFPEPTPAPVVLRHDGEADRALALTYWPADDDSDPERVRVVRLLDELLDLRLTDKVREEEAATYSPQALSFLSSVNPGYGYIGASLDLKPEDVDPFFDIVDEIAADLVAGHIDEDELARARTPVLKDLEEAASRNPYWLQLVATAQSEPEYLDRHREAEVGYMAVTAEDVAAAAARYLDSGAAYRVVILPADGT